MGGAKRWCFTLNNPSVSGEELSESLDVHPGYVFQKEVGEKNTEHFQGHIIFAKRMSLNEVKKIKFLEKAHWEIAKGTWANNVQYCTKEPRIAGPWKKEIPASRQGERTDLQQAADLIKEGSVQDVAEQMPDTFIRYHRGLVALQERLHQDSNEDRQKEIIYIWGPSGVGKSRLARTYPGAGVLDYANNFFAYDPCETCIIEEADTLNISEGNWLRIMDRYPFRLRIIGGWINFNPVRIVLTSNVPPEICFNFAYPERFMRRITQVIHLAQSPEVAGNTSAATSGK